MILDEIVERITGRWAASFKAWAYLSAIGSLGTISRTYTLLDITHKQSILIALAIFVISSPFYLLLSSTLLRKRYTENLSLARVFSFYIIFWLTVSLMEIIITVYVLHKTAYLGPQLFAPLFPDITGLIASSYLLAEFEKNRQDLSRLAFAQSTLIKTAQESHDQVIAERLELISAIQNSVFYQLDALKKQFSSIRSGSKQNEIQALASELEEYSTNTIRSLSHEMAKDTDTRQPIDRLSFIGSKKIKPFTASIAPLISFKLSIVTLLVVGSFHELSLNGIRGFIFQIVLTLPLLPILFFGEKLTRRYSGENLLKGSSVFLLTIFFCGYLTFLAAFWLDLNNFHLRNEYSFGVFAGRSLASVVVTSMIVTIVEARRKTLSALVAMNEKLQVNLEWMDNRSRELRREIASILHGPLQGRIAGVVMSLRLLDSNSESSESEKVRRLQEIEELLSTVISDVQELFKVESHEPDASIVIKLINLRRSWNGIAVISWSIQPEVFASVPSVSFEALSEVLYEAVSNSVRHGGATSINIIFEVDSKLLTLTISDNGAGIKDDFTPGSGLHKIAEVGGTYQFTPGVEQGAQLVIHFALHTLGAISSNQPSTTLEEK
jgi:signal transduction histidine kinase